MFLKETIQRCSRCDEVTPHSRRTVALPKIVSGLAAVGGGACCWVGDEWTMLGVPLLVVALFVFLRDRERCWFIACERCRGKERRNFRDTGPTLDGRTEINIL